jgi:hypothetical protein
MNPATSGAGETKTISEPLMAGIALEADGGAAAPTQVAVQPLQVACWCVFGVSDAMSSAAGMSALELIASASP